jgi:hypothetical protein
MKHISRVIIIAGIFLPVVAATAQTTCQTYGNQTYCNGPGRSGVTTQTYGNQTFIQQTDPSGRQRSVTCQTYGNQTYCN